MAIKVLIADDHPVFRAGIRSILEKDHEIQILGEAKDGEEAINMAKKLHPDIVIMDISMPDIDGIEATKQILSMDQPNCKVMALSIHSGKRFVKAMLEAGASGYVLKDSVPDELLTAITKISQGNMYLSSSITSVALEKDMQEVDGADIHSSALLQTKMHRPPMMDDYVMREDIINFLEENIDKPLSLISAPAGFGKSVLISQWMEQIHTPHAWISLDEEHNDLRVFLLYFQAAMEKIFPGSLKKISNVLNAIDIPPYKVISHTLINELDQIDQNFVLVFDDFYKIRNEEIHYLIKEILQFPPECLHLVLITRRDPPLPINTLRLNNRINEVRMQELAFSKSDIISLFQKWKDFTLDEKTARSLHEKTEGWIIGLRLASLTLKNLKDMDNIFENLRGDLQMVSEFLVEEVLSSQNAEIQEMLLKTSVLDRFSENLIDTLITSDKDNSPAEVNGDKFIRHLIQTNLFVIPLDTEGVWFRYHHLFQELLSNQLMKRYNETEYSEIHFKVARWFEMEGFIDESIEHYLLAGNEVSAANLVEKHAHTEFLKGVSHVDTWLKKLPVSAKENHPALLLIQAWYAFGQFHLEKIPALLEKAMALIDEKTTDPQILAEINFFQGNFLYWMGDTGESIKMLKHALNLEDTLPVHVRCNAELILNMALQRSGAGNSQIQDLQKEIKMLGIGGGYPLAYTFGSLVFVHLLSGNLPKAREVARQWQIHSTKSKAAYFIAWSHFSQASANLQMFNLDDALLQFKKAIESRYSIDLRVVLDAMASVALIQHFNNQQEDAKNSINELMEFVSETGDPVDLLIANSAKARIALLQNDLDTALSWAEEFTEKPTFAGMFFWLEVPWITKAKVLIAKGTTESLKRAVELLQELVELADSSNLVYQTIEIKILLSLAFEKQKQFDEAMILLGKAVTLAKSLGWIRPFIEAGPEMSILLKKIRSNEWDDSFVDNVTALINNQKSNKFVSPLPTQISPAKQYQNTSHETISIRELEIIDFVAQGYRNKEIARKLYVEEVTIKKHIYNIFKKLDVSSRIIMVQKAKELGIIDHK